SRARRTLHGSRGSDDRSTFDKRSTRNNDRRVDLQPRSGPMEGRAMHIIYPRGAAPLDPNEIDGLIPSIRYQSELNAREEDNIIRCRRWALSSRNRRLRSDLLSVAGLKLLHQRMFDEVWKWAGSFRLTEKNIGILAYQITPQLHNLCEDVKAQLAHQSYLLDECAVRF